MFNLVSMNRRWVISMLVMLGICLIGSCDRPKIVVVRVTEPTLNATVAGVRVVYLKNNFTEVFVNNADTLASAITDSNGEAIFENISGKSNDGTYSFRALLSSYFISSNYYNIPRKNQLDIIVQPRYNLRCQLITRSPSIGVNIFVNTSLSSETYVVDKANYGYFEIPIANNQEAFINLSRLENGFITDSSFSFLPNSNDTTVHVLTLP